MKILVQSDDYGITRAVSLGCIHGIKNGVVRNTGMFANMPWIEECVEWIKPYLGQIAFGIDLNASTGPSILGHDRVPALTHEDGTFLGSRENRALDCEENDFDHLADHADQLKAEDNHIVRMWRECGLKVENAGDSQALIQLKKQYCDRKDCLHCRIGFEYMRKPQS